MNGPASPAAAFGSTEWSVVLAVRCDPARRQLALENLCRTYWLPIYTYLRRHQHSPADAADATQGFFAHVLAGDFFERPDPARGKFRSFLIGALKQFVQHQRQHDRALKRGGDREFIALEGIDTEAEFAVVDRPELDPGAAYELSWAVALIGRAHRLLEAEQQAAGCAAGFAALKPFLHAPPRRGDYARVAAELGTSRATVAVWLHRLT